jgi:hypothetical protein
VVHPLWVSTITFPKCGSLGLSQEPQWFRGSPSQPRQWHSRLSPSLAQSSMPICTGMSPLTSGGSGATLEIYGSFTSHGCVSLWTGEHTFMVTDCPCNNGIIGTDFIIQHCDSGDIVRGHLIFATDGTEVALVCHTKQQQSVRICINRHIVILPGEEMFS